MRMVEDEALVADALAKGPEAFAPIVRRYQSAVFGVALARVRDFHEAEDIAQAVFVDAFLQLDHLQDARRLGPWLRTMAINKGIDWLRRRRDHVDVESIANDPRHAEMPPSLLEDGVRDQVMTAIARLGAAQRETITLHYLGGYSVQEIADMQGAPVGTVKTRLHHGRKALKRDLAMVETTLTSQKPPADLAQRVFEALSRHDRRGQEIYRELRELEAGKAIEGFARAAEAPSPDTRHLQVSDEVMHSDFLPLAMDLLFDRSLYVRQRVSGFLEDWAALVPLETAARALLEEPHPKVRGCKENLLRAVLDAQSGPGPKIDDDAIDEQVVVKADGIEQPTEVALLASIDVEVVGPHRSQVSSASPMDAQSSDATSECMAK